MWLSLDDSLSKFLQVQAYLVQEVQEAGNYLKVMMETVSHRNCLIRRVPWKVRLVEL